MKNIVLSAVAVLAMSSFAVAGGDIAPIEEPIVEEVVVVENLDAGFYLGLGYGLLNAEITDTYKAGNVEITDTMVDDDFGEIMLQAGYKFNAYVAIEGRYWAGVNDGSFLNPNDEIRDAEYGMSIDSFGIYVKPMYPVTEAFDVYALLGYASTTADIDQGNWDYVTDDVDGFSWGLGVAYSFNNNVSIFADYVNLYDDADEYAGVDYGLLYSGEHDRTIDTINVGVTYQF